MSEKIHRRANLRVVPGDRFRHLGGLHSQCVEVPVKVTDSDELYNFSFFVDIITV
jgi:hypothetical protein